MVNGEDNAVSQTRANPSLVQKKARCMDQEGKEWEPSVLCSQLVLALDAKERKKDAIINSVESTCPARATIAIKTGSIQRGNKTLYGVSRAPRKNNNDQQSGELVKRNHRFVCVFLFFPFFLPWLYSHSTYCKLLFDKGKKKKIIEEELAWSSRWRWGRNDWHVLFFFFLVHESALHQAPLTKHQAT